MEIYGRLVIFNEIILASNGRGGDLEMVIVSQIIVLVVIDVPIIKLYIDLYLYYNYIIIILLYNSTI